MGNCTQAKKKPSGAKFNKYYQKLQYGHLHLMYLDISSRTYQRGITRQLFDVFFHLNGLWSASMYKMFDKDLKGYIQFQQFSQNLINMTKGSFEQKCQVLFDLYSISDKKGVSYQTLTKMFYSYSKQQINKMVIDQKFLKTINPFQLTCFFDPQRKIKDAITFEKDQTKQLSLKNGQIVIPTPQQMIKMRDQLSPSIKKQKTIKVQQNSHQNEHHNAVIKSMLIQSKDLLKLEEYSRRRNSVVQDRRIKISNFKLTSNITFLIKNYANFIFEEFNLQKKTDLINFEQFKVLLKNHENVFDIYFQGFHTYVWQYDESESPLYKTIPITIQAKVTEIQKTRRQQKYMALIKTTVFIFKNKEDFQPIEIKCLQGLYIRDLQKQRFQNGISIFHRDGIYPQKFYIFQQKKIKQEWLINLDQYVKGNILQEFQIIQLVATGSFAKVYQGKQKSTNQKVAIKVIQKDYLNKPLNEVIKKECSMLKLCHHPNIIKFIKNFDMKSYHYIITQFLNQGDLFQYIKQKSFLEQYEAASVFKQLLESIQYLNQLGIIHRDLKPENIMIQLNQQKTMINKVKLIDFGFAVYKNQLPILSKQQKYAGTPGYIAPQLLNLQEYDEKADMFSLGIILYFMLSGYLPFYSPICEQMIEQTKRCLITLRNSHWQNVSKQAKDLIQGLLCYKQERLSLKQVIQHDWLKDIQKLKLNHGVNRRVKTKK